MVLEGEIEDDRRRTRARIDHYNPLYLHPSDNPVRGNVLMMNPTPTISQVYSMLIHEEKQKEVKSITQSFMEDSSAMNTNGQRSVNKQSDAGSSGSKRMCTYYKKTGHTIEYCWKLRDNKEGNVPTRRPSMTCTHYKKTRHTVDNCYKIIGYPNTREQGGKQVVAQASSTSDGSCLPGFTAEQCAQLMKLLSKNANEESDFSGAALAGPFIEDSTGSW